MFAKFHLNIQNWRKPKRISKILIVCFSQYQSTLGKLLGPFLLFFHLWGNMFDLRFLWISENNRSWAHVWLIRNFIIFICLTFKNCLIFSACLLASWRHDLEGILLLISKLWKISILEPRSVIADNIWVADFAENFDFVEDSLDFIVLVFALLLYVNFFDRVFFWFWDV